MSNDARLLLTISNCKLVISDLRHQLLSAQGENASLSASLSSLRALHRKASEEAEDRIRSAVREEREKHEREADELRKKLKESERMRLEIIERVVENEKRWDDDLKRYGPEELEKLTMKLSILKRRVAEVEDDDDDDEMLRKEVQVLLKDKQGLMRDVEVLVHAADEDVQANRMVSKYCGVLTCSRNVIYANGLQLPMKLVQDVPHVLHNDSYVPLQQYLLSHPLPDLHPHALVAQTPQAVHARKDHSPPPVAKKHPLPTKSPTSSSKKK